MNDPNNPPPYEGAAGGIVGAAMRAKARKRARLAKEAQGQEQVHEVIADGNFGVLTPKQVALFLADVNGGRCVATTNIALLTKPSQTCRKASLT